MEAEFTWRHRGSACLGGSGHRGCSPGMSSAQADGWDPWRCLQPGLTQGTKGQRTLVRMVSVGRHSSNGSRRAQQQPAPSR